MALSKSAIIGILVGVGVGGSVLCIFIGLIPVFQRVSGNGSSGVANTGASPSSGSNSTTTTVPGATTTTVPGATTTRVSGAATTTVPGATTTTTTTTTAPGPTTTTVASSIPAVACNADYQAIAGHSICIAVSADLLKSGISAANKPLIVDNHNAHRRNPYPKGTPKYGSAMRKLVWDDNLAAIAQQYARSCPADHEASNNQRKVVGLNVVVGQNLAWGYTTWTEAIDGWFSEYQQFTYGSGGTNTGHYTQMVYDETTRVGCGYAQCDTSFDTYFVCNYTTIQYANKMKSPFVAGTPCTACVSKCDNSLCDCNGLLCNTGTIDLNTCTCN